jgi:uncharacterized protein (TIGR00730 family)
MPLTAGGAVIGVMPRSLVEREIQHTGLTELHIVATMHERKTKMAELADGFVALPGGAGTFEEIFEQWTWAQLGIHHKPCGFLNTNRYFEPLRKMIAQMVGEGFLRPEYESMLVFDTEPAAIIGAFREYSPPIVKWQAAPDRNETMPTVIRIVAALVQDEARRVLLVRKRGTRAFMQRGHREAVRKDLYRDRIGKSLFNSLQARASIWLNQVAFQEAGQKSTCRKFHHVGNDKRPCRHQFPNCRQLGSCNDVYFEFCVRIVCRISGTLRFGEGAV